MANRYDIIHIDFQASAKGANAAIESIRREAEAASNKVTELKAKIAEAPKNGTDGKILEGWNAELKVAERRLRQFSTAQRELVKGMRALDEGVKMFNDGSLSSMNAAFQKQVNNAAKLAQSKLETGTKEWRQMGAIMQETEQNYARMQRDTDQLVESLQNGGTVFRKTLEDEKKGLQDLLQVLPYMGTEYRKAEEQLQLLTKATDDMIIKERQLKGEIVTTDDARRVSLQLTREGAEAARKRAEAADVEIENGKREIEVLEKERAARDANARASAQAASEYRENQRMYEDEIEVLEKEIKAEEERAASGKTGVEALKRKAQAAAEAADKEIKAQNKLDAEYETAKGKVAALREEYEKMKQAGGAAPAKDAAAGAEKASAEKSEEASKKKAEAKKEEKQATEEVVETQKEELVTEEALRKAIKDQETALRALRAEREKMAEEQRKGAAATKAEANAFAELSKEEAQALLNKKQAKAAITKGADGKMSYVNAEEAQRFLIESMQQANPENKGDALSLDSAGVAKVRAMFKERYGLADDADALAAIKGLISGGNGSLIKGGMMNNAFSRIDLDVSKVAAYNKEVKDLTTVINGETKAVEENVELKRTLADIDAEIEAGEKEQRETVLRLRKVLEGQGDTIGTTAKKNEALAESHKKNTEAIKEEIEAIKQMSKEQAEAKKKEMTAPSSIGYKAGKLEVSNLEEVQHFLLTQISKKGSVGKDGTYSMAGQNVDNLLTAFQNKYGLSGKRQEAKQILKDLVSGKNGGLFQEGGIVDFNAETLLVKANTEAYQGRIEKLKALISITNSTAQSVGRSTEATKKDTEATKSQTDAIKEQEQEVARRREAFERKNEDYEAKNARLKEMKSALGRLPKSGPDAGLMRYRAEEEIKEYNENIVKPARAEKTKLKGLWEKSVKDLMKMQGLDTEETKKNTEAENQNAEAMEKSAKGKRGKKKASEDAAKAAGEEAQKSAELIAKEKELKAAEDAEAEALKNKEAQQKKANDAVEKADAAADKAKKSEADLIKSLDEKSQALKENKENLEKLNEENRETVAANEQNQKLLAETNRKIQEQGDRIRDAERIKAQAHTDGIEKTEQAIRLLTEENRRIDQNSFTWKRNTIEIQHLQEALDEMKGKPALMMMEQRMKNVGALSASAVTETKRFWEAVVAGSEKGSERMKEAEGHLKTITEEEQKRNRAALEASSKRLGGNLGNLSQDELRQAVADAKTLQASYKSTSKEAKDLAASIINAEEHVKHYGIEAERAARKQEESDRKAERAARDKQEAEMQAQQEQRTMMMQRSLKSQRKKLSAEALAETRKYWEAVKNGAEEGSVAQRNALTIMQKITGEEQERAKTANEKLNKRFEDPLTDYSEKEIREAIDATKELMLQVGTGEEKYKEYGEQIVKAEEHLRLYGLEAQRTAVRQEQVNEKIGKEGKEVLEKAQKGDYGTASMADLDDAIKKLKAYQSVIQDPNGTGQKTFADTKEQIDGLTARLNALKGVAEKVKGTFADADEVLKRFGEHLNGGKTASESMAQTLEERLAGATSSWDGFIEEDKRHIAEYDQRIKDVTADIGKMEKELAELEKKHAGSSWFRRQTKAYRSEQRRIEELREDIGGEHLTDEDGEPYITGAKGRLAFLKDQKRFYEDELIADNRRKARDLGITEEEIAAEEKKKQARKLTNAEMQEGIKLLEQEFAKTDHTTEAGIRRRNELRTAIDQMNQEIKESTGEWMSYGEAQEYAAKAGGKGFIATANQMQQATQALERHRDQLIKTIQLKQKDGEATKKEEAELEKLEKQLKDLKFEQDNFNMSHKRMEELLRQPKKSNDLDELRAAIKRADGELHRMEQSLGKNSDRYQKFAKEVKAAKLELKEIEGQAKATAGTFDKAWSRLKTYVGLYMGFNAVWGKLTGTIGDIHELSDRMGEVQKTTGFAADEVGRLSDNLAKIDTRTNLVSLMEISAKGGQLGLKTIEDVQGFTEAANKLMVALPEMGAEASTEIMKVALATGEVDKIRKQMEDGLIEGSSATAVAMEKVGSTIDQLRANSASAAPAITDFVKRVGAVGAQSGITIDQVAALGSTVDALGMKIEMSATALSRMIPAIRNNAFEVAKSIGMAPEALRKMFDEADGGMNAMLAIFQHIKDSGMDADSIESMLGVGNMKAIMKDLNQMGARAGIVFAGLSQNVDELRRQLGVARTAYEENIAIQQEYDRMNETTAAKWERLKNQLEEMFVGNQTQSALGWLIDQVRKLVDLISGPLNDAFWALSVSVGAIKLGLTSLPEVGFKAFDYLRESALKASQAMEAAANATENISKASEGVDDAADAVGDIGDALDEAKEAGEQAGEAMEAASGAVAGVGNAAKVSIFSVKGLKTAWQGLDATMKANILVAVAALLYTVGKALYNAWTETQKHNKAVAEANAMIGIAIDRFEGYWDKLKETKTALDQATKSTEGLKEGSDDLTKATVEVVKADNAHKAAIADINSIYGKYLGFMLTEANYANLSAAAHDKVTAAIRREMLMKQQQAAIDQVTQENTENLKNGLSRLTEELRENSRLDTKQAAQAKIAVQKFMRENIKFDVGDEEYSISEEVYKQMGAKGADIAGLKKLDANKLAAAWLYNYLEDTFHLDTGALEDITGITKYNRKGGAVYGKALTSVMGRNFMDDYANAYLENMKDVAEYEHAFAGDLASAKDEEKQGLDKLMKGYKKQAAEAHKKILDKSLTDKERDAAYEDLANTLEGIDASIGELNPVKDKKLIDEIKKQADNIAETVDKTKLERARTNARTIFARATGGPGGESPTLDLNPEKNPWGDRLSAESTEYKNMTAEILVERRKQMKNFVNSIQTDSDVQAVLKEDAALQTAIRKGMSSDMRTVIEWYNQERLKIQDELYSRHLTNTGDWLDPKKSKESWRKQLQTDLDNYLKMLDAYYTKRKAEIQEAGNDEGLSEAEIRNRQLANDTEWQQRRLELQQIYLGKREKVAKDEVTAIMAILAEMDEDTPEMVEKLIGKSLDKWKILEQKAPEMARRLESKFVSGVSQSMLKMQQIVHQQMKAIEDIINKERPFNGITKNLRENLVTMGILTADMTKERDQLMKDNADMTDFNRRQTDESLKRTVFLLGEAEHAYTATIEGVMKRMADAGMTAWAEELKANPKMQEGLLAQLHSTYDAIQEAIKKEASLMKKQAEIMWNNILLPGSNGKTTVKDAFEQTIAQLGIEQGRVSRANSLIGAGVQSERWADKLAIKQMQLQLAMQRHYYKLMEKQGRQRINDLKRQIELAKQAGDIEKAKRLELDKQHADMSLNLAMSKEQTDILKQQEEIIARTEESQARLYQELREWGELISSSVQSVFEASNAGNREYYNELAKMKLTGKGGPGAGTYMVIENEGTSDARAHYEQLNERQALERQREIEQQNAMADAWRKLADDINMKMSEQITDWMNSAALDANTQAVMANTEAILQSTGGAGTADFTDTSVLRRDKNGMALDAGGNTIYPIEPAETGQAEGLPRTFWPRTEEEKEQWKAYGNELWDNHVEYGVEKLTEMSDAVSEMPSIVTSPVPTGEEQLESLSANANAAADIQIGASDRMAEKVISNQNKVQKAEKDTEIQMVKGSQSTFAKMTQAANLYGIAYQAMSNENLSTAQKFEMFALQAAGNAAISLLTTDLATQTGKNAVQLPGIFGKLMGEMPYPAAIAAFAAVTAILGGLMGLAVSQVAKSKSQISQVTGASINAGRLATGMMTYGKGNVNELTDPSTLTPGRQYNVDAADGHTYRARYMGDRPKTRLTHGPEFHLVGEKGQEAIIDAHTTRNIRLNEPEIWHNIQTLYNGGRLSATRRRGRGVHAFAGGNLDDFEETGSTTDGGGGGDLTAIQASLDRNSAVQEALLERLNQPIYAQNILYGPDGLPNVIAKLQKEAARHGEKFL